MRATLTGVNSAITYGTAIFLGLVVTPITVNALGAATFGLWVMLGQLTGYLSFVDVGPTKVLKLTLATEQHSHEFEKKRRQIGAALLVGLGVVPLYALAAWVAVLVFPRVVPLDAAARAEVVGTLAVLAVTAALGNILALPGAVLRAMNLDYEAMGWQGGIALATGVADIVVLLSGGGLVLLACNRLGAALALAAVRLRVARRRLPWFGADRPTRAEMRLLLGRSGWLTMDSVTGTLGQRSDLLVMGSILSPVAAAAYALTRNPGRMLFDFALVLFSSVNPGTAELAGRRAWESFASVRKHLLQVAVVVGLAFAATVFVWNEAFIALWVGADKYAGPVVTGLLMAYFALALLNGCHRGFLAALLLIREDVGGAAVRSLVVFAATVAGVVLYGAPGAAAALLLGELALGVYYSRLLARRAGAIPRPAVARMLLAAIAVAALAVVAEPYAVAAGWLQLVAAGAATGVVAVLLSAALVLDRDSGRFLRERLARVLPGRLALRTRAG